MKFNLTNFANVVHAVLYVAFLLFLIGGIWYVIHVIHVPANISKEVITDTIYLQSPNQTAFEYPLNSLINMEVVSNLGNPSLPEAFVDDGAKLISVSHKISLDEATKDYVYTYQLTYRGKERCFLVWGLLDKVIKMSSIDFSAESNPLNSLSFPNMVELVPGESKEFTLRSKDTPYFSKQVAFIYKSKDGGVWEYIRLDAQPGPLPLEKVLIP